MAGKDIDVKTLMKLDLYGILDLTVDASDSDVSHELVWYWAMMEVIITYGIYGRERL